MIQIGYNAIHACLVNPTKEIQLEVNRLLSYAVAGSDHMAAFKSGGWNGRSSFFNFSKSSFPRGFVDLVTRGLRQLGHEVQIICKPLPAPLGAEVPVVDAFGNTPRYDYQLETVEKLIKHGQMIAQVATGGGKSRICRMAYKRIDRNTLFLTTRGILMHQMKRAVIDMGEEVAVLGDGEWGIRYTKSDGSQGRRLSKFCVGTVQTLSQRLEVLSIDTEYQALISRRAVALGKKVNELKTRLAKKGLLPHLIGIEVNKMVKQLEAEIPKESTERAKIKAKVENHERMRLGTVKFLERFEFVIAEEAHELSGNGFFTVMKACKNANYRLALTATPFMKSDEEANMKLLASCGPIAITVTEKLLIDRGILAKPYFKFLKLPEESRPKGLFRSTPWQTAYSVGIVKNVYRNKLLCVEVLRAVKYGLNALILVHYKEHGAILKTMLISTGLRAEFIDGDSDQAERDRCLKMLGDGDLDVLIGSTILDVGVDVPSIGMIVLAGGSKAEVALRQRIGRGLREKKGGRPNVALIVDVYDEQNNHLKSHSGERQAVIKATAGFGENIVKDFDFAALGLDLRAA